MPRDQAALLLHWLDLCHSFRRTRFFVQVDPSGPLDLTLGLAPMGRLLLLSDGSVTRHLRLLTGKEARVAALPASTLDLVNACLYKAHLGSLGDVAGLG